MCKKLIKIAVFLLIILITPEMQSHVGDDILQHPEIQKAISQNPQLETKLRDIVERLPSDLNTEYLARRIASFLESCSEPEGLEIYFNELMRDSRNFSEQKLENQWADISINKANNVPLTSHEKETITTVIEDFQVNENVGSCWQSNSAVAVDNEGNFVVVWEDGRNSKWDDKRSRTGGFPIWKFDIYARCFNKNGQPLGNSFLVTDMGVNPAVAIDSQGRIIITWEWNMRRFVHYILAQRFDFNGNSLGDSFKVNEVSNGFTPDVACDYIGNFAIAWGDDRDGNKNIYVQHYDSTGLPIGANFSVIDDTTQSSQTYPAIAFDNNRNFVVTWEDHRSGNADIYAQRYDSLRNTIDVNFKVNDDPEPSWQNYPDIAVDGDGKFVITWRDGRDSNRGDIFAQRYHADGEPDSTNFKVNDDTGNNRQYNAVVAIDKEGSFLITWYDNRNGNYDIYAQHFDSSGIAMGENKKVNDDTNSVDHRYPSIAASRGGIFVITWIDQRNGDYDIYLQRYNSLMQPLEPNFRVNDDTVSSYQIEPAIAVDGNGNSIIVWRDYRNEMWGDIYGQRYDANGSALDTNFRVNDDVGWNGQGYPDIAMFKDGHFIITWHDNRNGSWDIFAQHYNLNGQKIEGNFMVNDVATKAQINPAIAAADDDSLFVIVWKDGRNYYYGDIYAQRFNYNRQKLGTNFRVNDVTENQWQDFPDVAVKNDGSFIVTWEDARIDKRADIYAQCYDSVGDTVGRNFKVNDDIGENAQWYPKIAISKEGNFVITWQDFRQPTHVYAQFYDSNRKTIGANVKVNDESFNSGGYPDISSCQNENFVIAFVGRKWGYIYDIFLQGYNKNGFPISENNFRITFDGDSPKQSYPCITTSSINILLAWEDNRVSGQGWDIFAKIVDWDWTKVKDKEIVNTAIPEDSFLFQNYPNPFNSETIIRYQLPKTSKVTLRILNLLGQEVKTLIDESMEAGFHQASWNGVNNSGAIVASGIYLYYIEAGDFNQIRKFIIIR